MSRVVSSFGNFEFPELGSAPIPPHPQSNGSSTIISEVVQKADGAYFADMHDLGFRQHGHNNCIDPIGSLVAKYLLQSGFVVASEQAYREDAFTGRATVVLFENKERGSFLDLSIVLGDEVAKELLRRGLIQPSENRSILRSLVDEKDFRMVIEQILWEDELAEMDGKETPFAEIRRIRKDTEARRKIVMDRMRQGGRIVARGDSLDEVMRKVRAQQKPHTF